MPRIYTNGRRYNDTTPDTTPNPTTPDTPPDTTPPPSSEHAPLPTYTSFTGGPYYTDALISGQSWTGSVSKPAEVHYTYATIKTSSDSSQGVRNPSALSSTQQASMDKAFQSWENVANIDFVKDATANSNTDIIVRQSDISSGSAVTYTWWKGSTTLTKGDIILDNAYISSSAPGTYGFMTMVHEIGHSLGLKHPGNYDSGGGGAKGPYLPKAEDSLNDSVMSYNKGSLATSSNPPTSPMIYDIAAAQLLYGANTSYNSGNTTYTFNGTKNATTIWDGGGNDTLDASGYSGASVIDLREGINNASKIGQAAVWAAFNANLENATGGKGNDTIYGNALSNMLTGNIGNDTMTGGAGNDVFVFYTGNGKDIITDFQRHSGSNGDTIAVDSSLFSSVSALMGSLSNSGSNAVLTLSSGNTITLSGISSSTLTVEDFQMV